ncbi:MAG TPA: folylpolyglutamate synthase/dihydrofolate synthase family protein [Chitinophagaceae bacterium]|nr:folylpolyglutamate synthase/dihydrofolate synthase family protein [Chitinophagaceae bacterium]
MNYAETLDYLYSQLPMFSRIGAAAFKKDLTNTIKLCEALEQPQLKFKTIHIAGTNGKGSVSHMLAAILQTAGYKTGLYTSPHLKDFRERIRINGKMIDEQDVISFTERIKPQIKKLEPSFFEITVAMAFDHFATQGVDIAVIETGLGGRYDSTNIIRPELSVITQIGWDHMYLLGDTLEKIAYEKAGIIKQAVPVVIGDQLPETQKVFEQVSQEKKADMTVASERRHIIDWKWERHQLVVEIEEQHQTDHRVYHLDLPGIYQARNLLTVLECCTRLNQAGWELQDVHIHEALKNVKKLTGLHGRWEILKTSPLLVVDVAHNVDGIEQLLQQIEVTQHRQLHIIIGLVKDKEIEKIIGLLPKQAAYYFTRAQIPRALPENELAEKARATGLSGTEHSEVNEALRKALDHADPQDMIIVCGSVFLVGELDDLQVN